MIIEGDSGTSEVTFTVTLSPATPEQVSFQYTSAPGTATETVPGPVTGREDYSRVFGAALFGPGGTTRTITVPVIGELRDEFDETFFIRISNPNNATIADAEGMATILDNDPPPTVSINDVSVNEASCVTTSAVFVASLSLASGKPISVDFATANATAIAGNDYVAASGTVLFNPEESAKQISVEVIADTANETEPDETFSVNLSNLTNVTVGDGQGFG
ncbi:MAG: Calx-beta domain-containing protein, partial [Pyrinomonadaceae bacterium]